MTSYTLDQIYNFTVEQIHFVLNFRNWDISSNDLFNKYNVTILLQQSNQIANNDSYLILEPRFNELYLMIDDQLRQLAQDRKIPYNDQYTHIILLRILLYDIRPELSFSAPLLVSELPKKHKYRIFLYEMNNSLYLCGTDTYHIKDRLKTVTNARWNSNYKCWSFPVNQLPSIQTVIQPQTIEPVSKLETVPSMDNEQRLLRLQQDEPEHYLVPYYQTMSFKEVVQTSREKLDQMAIKYYAQVKLLWQDKIHPISQDNELYRYLKDIDELYTYDGPLKPPDTAFIMANNNWQYDVDFEINFVVERVDYRIYNVKFIARE